MMKKFLISLLMTGLLASQGFTEEDPYDVNSVNSANPRLISKVKSRLYKAERKGRDKQAESWAFVLDALQGKHDDAMMAYVIASSKAQTTKAKKNRKLWGQVADVLGSIVDLQLMGDHDYDFDTKFLKVIQKKLDSSSGQESEVWRNVLRSLVGKEDRLASSIQALKYYMKINSSAKPAEWNELIEELERYTAESYEEPFVASVESESAYVYKIRDAETNEIVGTIDASKELFPGERIGGATTGRYGTSAGRTSWELRFAKGADGDTNYVSYGYWSRSRVPEGEEGNDYNERQTAVFYDGDNPAGNVDKVRGYAVYKGVTIGVIRQNTPESQEIDHFSGSVELKVNFEEDNIQGHIDNLGDSRLPNRIDLGQTNFDSDGGFDGEISGFISGEYSGQFYNQDSSSEAPEHVGGDYSFRTGFEEDDFAVEGAFGASEHFHLDHTQYTQQ